MQNSSISSPFLFPQDIVIGVSSRFPPLFSLISLLLSIFYASQKSITRRSHVLSCLLPPFYPHSLSLLLPPGPLFHCTLLVLSFQSTCSWLLSQSYQSQHGVRGSLESCLRPYSLNVLNIFKSFYYLFHLSSDNTFSYRNVTRFMKFTDG